MAEEPNLNEAILKVEDIHTFIGHHHILQGLSFEARADAVTVLIGRNGAGKSTTLRTVMGLLPANQGKIIFNGKEIQKKKPYEIARLGLGFVPEDMGIFANLTVEENMRVAMLAEDEATGQRLERTLDMFRDLKNFWKAQAGILSGGQKQMLAIARAIGKVRGNGRPVHRTVCGAIHTVGPIVENRGILRIEYHGCVPIHPPRDTTRGPRERRAAVC